MPRRGDSGILGVALRCAVRPAVSRIAASRRLAVLGWQHRKAERFAGIDVGLRNESRKRAYAADVSRALGYRNGAARIEQIEGVPGLEDHFIAGQRKLGLQQAFGLALEQRELLEKPRRVRLLEVVRGLLDLALVEDVAVGELALDAIVLRDRPHEVEHVLQALQRHREGLEPVGQLAVDWITDRPRHLLKVR